MSLTGLRTRLIRLRTRCREGHEWTELAQPVACRLCGRTREGGSLIGRWAAARFGVSGLGRPGP